MAHIYDPHWRSFVRTQGSGWLFLSLVLVTISSSTDRAISATRKSAKPVDTAFSTAFNTANTLAGHGLYKDALEKYRVAVQIEPGNPKVYQMYGRTLALMGLLASAIDQYQLAFKLQHAPSSDLEYDLGVAFAASGDNAEGARHLKKALNINPKFVAAYNNLGVALMRLGDYRGAKDAFEISLKMQPTNKAIESKLEELAAKLGESKHFDFTAAPATVEKPSANETRQDGPPTEKTTSAEAQPSAITTSTPGKSAGVLPSVTTGRAQVQPIPQPALAPVTSQAVLSTVKSALGRSPVANKSTQPPAEFSKSQIPVQNSGAYVELKTGNPGRPYGEGRANNNGSITVIEESVDADTATEAGADLTPAPTGLSNPPVAGASQSPSTFSSPSVVPVAVPGVSTSLKGITGAVSSPRVPAGRSEVIPGLVTTTTKTTAITTDASLNNKSTTEVTTVNTVNSAGDAGNFGINSGGTTSTNSSAGTNGATPAAGVVPPLLPGVRGGSGNINNSAVADPNRNALPTPAPVNDTPATPVKSQEPSPATSTP